MSVLRDQGLGAGSSPAAALAARRLGVRQVSGFVGSAMAPLTTAAGALPAAYAVTGQTGIPIAFVGVGVLLAVFAVGYCAMAQRIPHSGAFYAYITHGLGRSAGVVALLIAQASYLAFVAASIGGVGAAVSALVESHTSADLPWWIYAFAGLAVSVLLSVLRVEMSSRILAALVVAELLVVLVLVAVGLTDPADGDLSWAGWSPARLADPGTAALAIVAVTAFVGFETTAVYAEEVRDRKRTVLRATFLTLGVFALLYAVAGWAIAEAAGPGQVVGFTRQHGADTIFVLLSGTLSAAAVTGAQVLFATGVLAALVAFHNASTRYVFAPGREGLLPARLGQIHARSNGPAAASLAVSGFGLLVLLVAAVLDLDPLVHLFFYAGSLGGFGVLILLVLASVAIVRYFAVEGRADTHWLVAFVAPVVSAFTLGAVLVLAVVHFDRLLGVPADDPLRWLPGLYLVAIVAGGVWAVILRSRRPDIYARIGLGPAVDHAPRRAATGPRADSDGRAGRSRSAGEDRGAGWTGETR
ncbi:APC family permease [Cryptosporangium sp. NPDC048952]|uniref:APC family permease n=1 Tax=Cryptosporangium sp. NPDC048952 TaxID=3363961 RepID=UPI003722F787